MLIRAAPSAQRAAFWYKTPCRASAKEAAAESFRLMTYLIRAEQDDAACHRAVSFHALEDALTVVQDASSRRNLQRAVRL